MEEDWAERHWLELVDFLNTRATASVLGPGRIEIRGLTHDGSEKTAELVLSSDDLETMWTVVLGSLDAAFHHVRTAFRSLAADEKFLVYDNQYEVVGSRTRTL